MASVSFSVLKVLGMWAGYSCNNQEVLVQFSLTYPLTIIHITIPLIGFAWIFEDRYASTIKCERYGCWRWIVGNVVHSCSYELSFLQDPWRGNTTLYKNADHNILGYADTPSNIPSEMLKSMFMHYFYQYSFSIFGINRNVHIHIGLHRPTGYMTVMVENGGHFENGIPIPDYQVHLVLDQFPYDLRTKSNLQE